jgi:multidrug efflux system membrane fusion protein
MTTRIETLAFALALAAAGWACTPARTDEAPARPVRVETVDHEAAASGLRYSASIQPYEQVPLAFKVGGYVRELQQRPGTDGRLRPLQQGDSVSRGSVLARIDAADYQQRVHQGKAQLAEAEAGLTRARADAGRAEALYGAQALTRPDYDAAVAGLSSAVARADAARAALEQAQLALGDSALVAPADAIVLARNVEVGTLAAPGTLAFTLADLTRVKAVFGVPDHVVSRVVVGTPLRLTTDAFPGMEFPGRVTAVSPSADPQSRVFGVEVTIPNAERRLKAGMIASVEVASRASADIPAGSPTVSVAAVVKSARPGGFAVFVVDGTDDAAHARARDVTLGRISGNRVAVDTGLAVGERVIVSGASLLVDGDRVRVIPGREGE